MFLSLGVSLIAAFPRLLRSTTIRWDDFLHAFVFMFVYSIICWFLHVQLRNYRERNWPESNRLLYTVFSILLVAMVAWLYSILFPKSVWGALHLEEVLPSRRILVVLIRATVVSSFYYFIIHALKVWSQKQQHELEIERLKQAELKANLASLKEQISPHFLFNTLNTLSTLTKEPIVKDYVNQLARVYRYTLQVKDENVVTLASELAFMEAYVYILKMRLEDAVDVQFEIPETSLNSLIPPLTLQELIENAVKHNVTALDKPLRIRLSVADEYLRITNNRQPRISVPYSAGVGLNNIAQRYQLLFRAEVVFEQTATAFNVYLPIIAHERSDFGR